MSNCAIDDIVVFKQFVESADVLFYAVDQHMCYTYISPFFAKTHHITLEDAIGKHFREVIGEDGFQNNLVYYRKVLAGQVVKYSSCFPKLNGNLHYYDAVYTPIREEGVVVGFTGVVLDATPQKKLEILSVTDQLTGLYNRRKLEESFQYELERFGRFSSSFGVILMDIDQFKKINDNFGHQTGDLVLQGMADILINRSRSIDIVGRWGGEEFIIICPESDIEGTLSLAESLRESIAEFAFPEVKSCTASFGVTCARVGDTIESIVSRVDEALYIAKNNGKNQVELI